MDSGYLTPAIVLAAFIQPAQAGDVKAGRIAYMSKGCIGCHGPAGHSSNEQVYPSTAGKEASHLIQQLKAFRAGERDNPIMTPMAASLTDEEIANIAAYLAAQD